MDCHFLLQGIFPTQELNPGLPHCKETLYHLSHQGFHIIQNITLATSYFSISCSKYFLLYLVPFSSLETLEYIYIRLVKWLAMRRKEKQKAWSQQTLGSELKAVTWMLWSSLFIPPFLFLPFSKLLCTLFQMFRILQLW